MEIKNPSLIKLSGLFKVDSNTEFNCYVSISINDLVTCIDDQFVINKITVTADKNKYDMETILCSSEKVIELFGINNVLNGFINDNIIDIVKNEPNDQALGFKLRKYFLN